MCDHTVRRHRVLTAPPERVYRAFTDPQAIVKWLPPHGFTAEVHEMDLREGGAYRMSFTQFSQGQGHSFGGRYIDRVPGQRLVYTNVFDSPGPVGDMRTTVALQPVFCGTELSVVQEGMPIAIPVQACLLGWQASLSLLALLVQADMPG